MLLVPNRRVRNITSKKSGLRWIIKRYVSGILPVVDT
ncbi:hypothetical protein RSAG8_06902, partial [Rhizoctonia solani AG-8 WAC10335]